MNFPTLKEWLYLTEAEGDRVGILHLYSLNQPELYSMPLKHFKRFVQDLKSDGGVVDTTNSKLSEKVDGMALKIGVDPKGFYLRTSYSGPVYSALGFEGRVKYEPAKLALQAHFDTLKAIFEPILTPGIDTVIQFEWLCMDLAKQNTDDSVVFVATKYSKQKLGQTMTLVYINAQSTDEDPAVIKERVLSVDLPPESGIKIVRSDIEWFEPVDLRPEIRQAEAVFNKIQPLKAELELVKGSRKRDDVAKRKQTNQAIQNMVLPVQKAMYEKLLGSFDNIEGVLGEIEGFVINTRSGMLVKINKPSFMATKFNL